MPSALASALVASQLVASASAFAWAAQSCSDGGGETDPKGSDASPDARPCTAPFVGDKSKAPSVEVIVLGADGTSSTLSDGGTAPLMYPPQGGRVIFAGVRAANID